MKNIVHAIKTKDMIKQIISSLFKKKHKKYRIRFKVGTWAKLEKAPPEGLFYLELKQGVIIMKEAVLIFLSEDKERIYFEVKYPFIAVGKQAPDGAIVYFSKYHFNQLTKTGQYKTIK